MEGRYHLNSFESSSVRASVVTCARKSCNPSTLVIELNFPLYLSISRRRVAAAMSLLLKALWDSIAYLVLVIYPTPILALYVKPLNFDKA